MLALSWPGLGPISIDSDDEEVKATHISDQSNVNSLETQPYALDTQVMMDALRNPADLHTPSPKPKTFPDISPVKKFPTRESQLEAKQGLTETSEAKQSEPKARGRGAGRGRGRGRGRGAGSAAVDPCLSGVVDADAEAAEEVVDETQPVKTRKSKKTPDVENRPKRKQNDVKNEDMEPKKTKKGQKNQEAASFGEQKNTKCKRKQVVHAELPQEAAPSELPLAKAVGEKNGAKRGKGRSSTNEQLLPKTKGLTIRRIPAVSMEDASDEPGQPATFARRYRPAKDSWCQRLWDGCRHYFRIFIAPEMNPGYKTKLEAGMSNSGLAQLKCSVTPDTQTLYLMPHITCCWAGPVLGLRQGFLQGQ